METEKEDEKKQETKEETKQDGIKEEIEDNGELKKSEEINGIVSESMLKDCTMEDTKPSEKELTERKEDVERSGETTEERKEEGEEGIKIDEETLKKLNKKVPDARSTFKKDDVDEHFDRLPWYMGALGRVLSLPFSLGPKFAPINISLSRRLETFAAFVWMSAFLFMGFGSLFTLIYMFFYTKYWWFSVAYFTWYLGDRHICVRGGRRWSVMRNWGLWKSYRDFFPAHLIKTAELDPSKNYIMGYHPHGVLSGGAFCHFATEGTYFSKVYPGLIPYLLTLECHFKLPFYRECFMATGGVSATRDSMNYLLSQEGTGHALCLVVGGAPESLDAHPGQVILNLDKRKGFCKMALRHGASLVPMFSFGENEIYDQLANPHGSLFRRIQNSIQKAFGVAPVVLMGRGILQYSFGIVPYRKPIYTVVGDPIDVPRVEKPTSEQIVDLHARYVKALINLYNKYKDRYSENPEVKLQII